MLLPFCALVATLSQILHSNIQAISIAAMHERRAIVKSTTDHTGILDVVLKEFNFQMSARSLENNCFNCYKNNSACFSATGNTNGKTAIKHMSKACSQNQSKIEIFFMA